MTRTRALRDAAAPGTGLVVRSWTVGSPDRQRAAVAAAGAAWEEARRAAVDDHAGEGRTARASCTCPGGATNARLRRYREAGVGGRGGDAAVPGIERAGVVPYRVLGQAPGSRSGTRPDGPGCVVLVDIATENRDRTTGWVTSMLELPPVGTEQTGLTAATSHVSLDGTRVLKPGRMGRRAEPRRRRGAEEGARTWSGS